MRCDRVEARLAPAAAGEVVLSAEEVHHVERCLRCQAELAQHRRVRSGLRNLRRSQVEPAAGALDDLLAGLRTGAPAGGPRHRPGYVVGLAAATVAGAVGAAVIASRTRRPAGAHG